MIAPSLADLPQGIDPAALAQEGLDPLVKKLVGLGSATLILILLALAVVVFLVRWIRARIRPPSHAPGPTWVAAALILIGVYLFALLLDLLLINLVDRPSWFPAERWDGVGWFEWKLLGDPILSAFLPLSRAPALALLVHVPLWFFLLWVCELGLRWFSGAAQLPWTAPKDALPWFFRWVGASTVRRADHRFRRPLALLIAILVPIHSLAGITFDAPGLAGPPPGAWVVAGLLLWVTAMHLVTEAKAPVAATDTKELGPEADPATDPAAPSAPLARLRAALEHAHPGLVLDPLERRPAFAGARVDFPPAITPLVREIFADLCGNSRPWAHQAAVLAHLASLWSLRGSALSADVTTLEEHSVRSPITTTTTDTPHALVLGGEGSGRTTLTLLAALHVFLDRGATSLVLVRSRLAARRWHARLGDALVRSSARWNVQVAVAGEDLAAPLLAGRTPAIIVADLEAFEAEILCNRRTDDFLARLGLVIADDLDAFFGVAEIHLQMAMRRLWALQATLHAASYPVVLLATASAGASGLETWARHVLAAPLRTFADDRAPTLERHLLRRRDLVDSSGDDLPLHELAAACESAELGWHLRLAGDPHREIQRADFEMGGGHRFYQQDPADALVILIEGTYPEVHREAERLSHAGWRRGKGPVLLVLAPPGDEEMVLHEEAEDAPARPLIAALPAAVPLGEPRIVRQRHLDRALGREQDLSCLRERLGAAFVDEVIADLSRAGKVTHRQSVHLDPRTDELVERTLIRAGHEVALGQPIIAECVTEASACLPVVDAGTAEPLLRIESAIARVVYPPGRIFLHPRGRYLVLDGGDRQILAEPIVTPARTTLDRRLQLHLHEPIDWSERQLGGERLSVAFLRAELQESVLGVRRIGPGPRLLEHRRFDRPPTATYGTDICLIRGQLGDGGSLHLQLTRAAAAPLCAAARMLLPCALRSAGDLLAVDLIELEGAPVLCFYDRTPGASGFCRHLEGHALPDLLRLIRLALGRLVGPERARLWHIHDTTPDADPTLWQPELALRWLAAALDPRPQTTEQAPTRPHGPRAEFAPGDAPGHLGRLWVSHSGRTDDLVWTRHTWWSGSPAEGAPPGERHLDVAVERIFISLSQRTPDSPEVRATLAVIRDHLHRLGGEEALDLILCLVAALPLAPRLLPEPQRSPLLVLAKRRADLEAKLALALALLPPDYTGAVAGDPQTRHLELTRAGRLLRVDLRGPHPRALP